ncbi:hypothetical protein Tco_0887537 [Tanacetum coccineum]
MDLNNFVVKDDMIDYVLHKYGSNWQVHDAIVDDILDDLLKREWEKQQRVKLFAIFVDDKRKVTQMKIQDLLEKRIEKVGQHLNKEKQIMDINKGKEKTVMKKRYDAPPDTTPIEEIAATGWGDEFSDDEVTPGKQELKSEWENPFASKRGENHTILYLSKEEENDDLPYLKFQNFKQVAAQIIKKHEEHAFPSTSQEESTQNYQPPHDSIMGPSLYPPAQQNPQPFYRPDYQFGYPQGKSKIFSGGYGEYYNSTVTLTDRMDIIRRKCSCYQKATQAYG